MKHPVLQSILLLLLLSTLVACQTVKEYQAGVDLDGVLEKYGAIVRWGSLEYAYGFLEPELAAVTSIPNGLENIRVTGYDVIKRPILLSETTATQTVKISYVLRDRQIQRTILDEQYWERAEDGRNWFRTNPIPAY